MQEMSLTDARADLTDLINRAQYRGETTLITRHRKAAAMITPVDAQAVLTDITATAIVDQHDEWWRNQAIDAWIEEAANRGYGFVVVETPAEGPVLAVAERDRWDDDSGERLDGGDRYTLLAEWPEDLNPDAGDPHTVTIQAVRRPDAYTLIARDADTVARLTATTGPDRLGGGITDLGDLKVRVSVEAVDALLSFQPYEDGVVAWTNSTLILYAEGDGYILAPEADA